MPSSRRTARRPPTRRARNGAWLGLALLLACLAAAGCGVDAGQRSRLLAIQLEAPRSDPSLPQPAPQRRVALSGAGGEWLDLVALHTGAASSFRVRPLRAVDALQGTDPTIAPGVRIYRVADVPVDTNRAGYLRLYGGEGASTMLPRALVPLEGSGGAFMLPAAQRGTPQRLWVDLQLPRGLARGHWRTAVDALAADGSVLATLPVEVESHGFDLPLERTLVVSAPVRWERLVAHFPEQFAGVSPELLSQSDPRAAGAVEVLEALARQAQADRLQVTVPALAPVVKWPAGRAPEAWWASVDELVVPWLDGSAFEDGVGVTDWPVPRLAQMDRLTDEARAEYWQAALAHFDALGLLDHCLVLLDERHIRADPAAVRRGTALSPSERLRLSQEAGRVAQAYPSGTIAVALESDQVHFTGPQNPGLYPPEHAARLMIRGDGLVTDQPSRPWPAGLPQPRRYLELEGPSAAPVPGPGASEADIRLWGWLAFLRGARHLQLEETLPAEDVLDPTQVVWFYPGEMFGAPGPVPSVQLKWLRRAQQDYEYLHACSWRLEESYARVIARALVRPVRVEQDVAVDPLMPLIAGTPDSAAWREGLALVAGKIAAADPALVHLLPERFLTDHTNRTTAWLAPRERPAPIITSTRWDLTEDANGTQRVILRLGTGIYNPSDATPEGMSLAFAEMPGSEKPGEAIWQNPGEVIVPAVDTYEVAEAPLTTSAPVDSLGFVFPTYQQGPLRIAVRNQYTGAVGTASAVAPAVVIDQRSDPPKIDGLLGEWLGSEAIIDGRMVLMHDRPALQAGAVNRTQRPAQAFVAWTADGLSVGFRLDGAGLPNGSLRTTRNFVDTQYRRVWGEDVCELLIQPVWMHSGDPVEGPLLHIVCKPDGAFARRRSDRRSSAEPWQSFESGMRFAATVDDQGVWRCEVMIPWAALRGVPGEQLAAAGPEAHPPLVRFNLTHHDGQSGRSASWAGPVDYGADEQFTGALILREGPAPAPAE